MGTLLQNFCNRIVTYFIRFVNIHQQAANAMLKSGNNAGTKVREKAGLFTQMILILKKCMI
jgi:hypothetical protein